MKLNFSQLKPKGFSLIELLISLAILSFVIGGSLIAFQAIQSNTNSSIKISEINNKGNLLNNFFLTEISKAGSYIPYDKKPPIVYSSSLKTAVNVESDILLLNNSSNFSETGKILTNNEIINYTNKIGNELVGLLRGVDETEIQSHLSDSKVYDFSSLKRALKVVNSTEILFCYDKNITKRNLVSIKFDSDNKNVLFISAEDENYDCAIENFPPVNNDNWNILDNNISNMNFVLQDFNNLKIDYEIISGGFSQSFNLDINLYEL